jgi:predicted ATPase
MLTHLRIRNFKAWKDTGSIRLAPLTVIFGANSAGKSSLGHLLLGLKQTALLTDRRRALHLGDLHSPVDLGSFEDCLHGHDLKAQLEFSLGWRLPRAVELRDPLQPGVTYTGEQMLLDSVMRAGTRGQPKLASFHYALQNTTGDTVLDVHHGINDGGKAYLDVEPLKLIKKQGRAWPIDAPEKFYRFSDVTLARYQNADALSQFPLALENLLAGLTHLGPLREPPKRTYSWAGDTVPDVGARGEFAIPALLAAAQAKRSLNRGYKKARSAFDKFIASWLRDLGVIEEFRVLPVGKGRKEYEVLVRTRKSSPEVKLTDVGFGVSQVLPALVQAFYAPAYSTVWMEQPEIHLHPQVQAELADAFISAVQAYENGAPRNVQLIIESHSEHFLMRLQRRIAEEQISPNDVAVYFARNSQDGVDLEALKVDMYGNIENWPDNFFGDEMADATARTQAEMQRRIKARGTAGG